MPEYIPRKEKEKRREWKCPSCGMTFATVVRGNEAKFLYKGKVFGWCNEHWEKVIVECPSCKGFIVFTREELIGE